MTVFRATFTTELVDGKPLDSEFVRTHLEEALEDIGALFVMDDDDHEAEYDVTVGTVEVVA
jgi:hypothetical protein